jgi:hypothetical protein
MNVENPHDLPANFDDVTGRMVRSTSKIIPETKFWAIFCIAKPMPTAKTAPAAKSAPRSIPAVCKEIEKPMPRKV